MSRSETCAVCAHLGHTYCSERKCRYLPYFPPQDAEKLNLLLRVYPLNEITKVITIRATPDKIRHALGLLYKEAVNHLKIRESMTEQREYAKERIQTLGDHNVTLSRDLNCVYSDWYMELFRVDPTAFSLAMFQGPMPHFASDANEKFKTLLRVYPVDEMSKIVTDSQPEYMVCCRALDLLHEEAKIHLAVQELTRKQREVAEQRTRLLGCSDDNISVTSDLHSYHYDWFLNLPVPENKSCYNNDGDEHVPRSNPSVTHYLSETIMWMLKFTTGPVMSGQSGLAQGGSSSTLPQPPPQPLAGTKPPPPFSAGGLKCPHQVPAYPGNKAGGNRANGARGRGQRKKRKA